MKHSNLAMGEDLTQAILEALFLFGWLTAAQLGYYVYSHASNPEANARKKLRTLHKRGFLFPTITTFGTQAWVLSKSGFNAVASNLNSCERYRRINPKYCTLHTALATWCALLREGRNEYSILQGHTSIPRAGIGNKRPDAIYHDEKGIVWIEVENSYKKGLNTTNLMTFLSNFGGDFSFVLEGTNVQSGLIVGSSLVALKNTIVSFLKHRDLFVDPHLYRVEFVLLSLNNGLYPSHFSNRVHLLNILLSETADEALKLFEVKKYSALLRRSYRD